MSFRFCQTGKKKRKKERKTDGHTDRQTDRQTERKKHILATALKPDIFILNETLQEVVIFELTCPWDSNINRSHAYKSEKYSPLVADLSQTHSVSFYSVEVSARGQITKENMSRVKVSSSMLQWCPKF